MSKYLARNEDAFYKFEKNLWSRKDRKVPKKIKRSARKKNLAPSSIDQRKQINESYRLTPKSLKKEQKNGSREELKPIWQYSYSDSKMTPKAGKFDKSRESAKLLYNSLENEFQESITEVLI